MRPAPTVLAILAAFGQLACGQGRTPAGTASDLTFVQSDTVGDRFGAAQDAALIAEEVESSEVTSDSDLVDIESSSFDSGPAPTDASTLTPDSVNNGTDALDSESGADVSEADTGVPSSNDTAAWPETNADVDKPWTLTGGCAIPQPPAPSAKCVAAACSPQEICVANGHCVPAGTTDLPSVSTNTAVTGISASADGSWTLGLHRKDAGAAWHAELLYFPSPAPVPLWAVEFENPDAVSTYGTVPVANSGGGWVVAAIRWTVQTGAFEVVVWPISQDGILSAPVPYVTSQSLISYDGMSPLGGPTIQIIQLRDQNFLVAWDGSAGGPASGPVSVRLRYLNSAGVPIGKEFSLAPSGTAFAPAIAPLALGAAGLAWHDSTGSKAKAQIATALLPPESKAIGKSLFASPGIYGQETVPALATWDDGGAILGWKAGNAPKTCPLHVFAQGLGTANMDPKGSYHELDLDSEGTYRAAPTAAVLDQDRAVLAWHNMSPKSQSVFLRRYYRSPDAVDCDNTNVAGPTAPDEENLRMFPVVAPLGAGSFVVAWTTSLQSNPAIGPYFVPRLRYFAY